MVGPNEIPDQTPCVRCKWPEHQHRPGGNGCPEFVRPEVRV